MRLPKQANSRVKRRRVCKTLAGFRELAPVVEDEELEVCEGLFQYGVNGAIQQGGVGASMADLLQEMYEGALKGLLGVEPGHRVERGTTTLEQALDPYFAK